MLACGLFLLLLGVLPIVADVDCGRVPPSLWCKNEELAQKCGVQEACKKYTDGSKGKKILLTVLYESLCPGKRSQYNNHSRFFSDCQEFITSSLFDAVYSKFSDYVQIELVPYGNAKKSDVSFAITATSLDCSAGREDYLPARQGRMLHQQA